MSNSTYINIPTVYRVSRSSSEPLGLEWLYAWYVQSSVNFNEVGFYTIEGINPFDWTSNSVVTIKFFRTTNLSVNEVFNVYCEVKMINNGVESCQKVNVAQVLVVQDNSNAICDSQITRLPAVENCIFAQTKYIYQYCCPNSIDYVYFTVNNGKAYDILGETQYPVSTAPIQVAADPVNFCAEIIVAWNEDDPINVYLVDSDSTQNTINIGAAYVITAFAERAGSLSKVNIKKEQVIPNNVYFTVIPISSNLYYTQNNQIIVQVSKITRYPQDYLITVSYKKRYKYADGSYSNYTTGIVDSKLVSTITSLSNNITPYTYNFIYSENLAVFEVNDPIELDISFTVNVHDSYVEANYNYEANYHDESCTRYLTSSESQYPLLACASTIDLPIGDLFSITITSCPVTTDLVFNTIFGIVVTSCTQTLWVLDEPCYTFCYPTNWILDNSCYHKCIVTNWILDSPCYTLYFCWQTNWIIDNPCYTISTGTSVVTNNYDININRIPLDSAMQNTLRTLQNKYNLTGVN